MTQKPSTLLPDISWSAALPVIRFSYGFALAAILSKNLSVSEYGGWSLFISLIGLVLTFSSLNLMYSSNILLIGKDLGTQRREIYSVGLTRFSATVLVYIGLAVYLRHADVVDSGLLWLLLAALVLRTFNDFCFGLCRSLLLLRRQILFLLVESCLIILAVAVASYFLGAGLKGALYGFLVAELLSVLLGAYILRDYLTLASFEFGIVKKYLSIGLPLVPFAFSDLIVNALVPLQLKLFDGLEAVAFYSIAQKVALVSTVPAAIVNNTYAQHLRQSRLSAGGSGVRRTFLRFLSIYLAMVLPLLVLMYLFGEDVIRFISTDEYAHAYRLMLLLMLVNVLVSVGSLLTTVFAVFEQTRLAGWIWLGVLGLFLALSRYSYDRWEVSGIAYALIFSFCLGIALISVGLVRLRQTVRRGSVDPE